MSKCLEIFALKKDIKMILLREFKAHKMVLIYNFLHTDACSSTNKIHYFNGVISNKEKDEIIFCCGMLWLNVN